MCGFKSGVHDHAWRGIGVVAVGGRRSERKKEKSAMGIKEW